MDWIYFQNSMHKGLGFALILLLAACAQGPYKTSDRLYTKQSRALAKTIRTKQVASLSDSAGNVFQADWISTVNFNLRKPNYVIIHHTAQKSVDETLKTFTKTKTQVSAHYLVSKDGKVIQLLNDYLRAWHGGMAKWGSITDINSVSIGIELDNDGKSPFTDVQLNALLTLLLKLKNNYGIPTSNFIGHSDIAPSRKIDPNVFFPWRKLSEKGFGLMPDSLASDPIPSTFDPIQALRVIGYDTKDPIAAIVAFKRHYLGKDEDATLSNEDLSALYNLYCKY